MLDSGDWVLADQLPAEPWHVLIYHQRGVPGNELHLWLPRLEAVRSGDFAFRRYWMQSGVRWCVEVPPDPDRLRSARPPADGPWRVRFTAPSGHVLWATYHGPGRLADLTDDDLRSLLMTSRFGSFTRI